MSKQKLGDDSDEQDTFPSGSYSEALKMEFENLSFFTPFNYYPEPQNKAQPTTKHKTPGKKALAQIRDQWKVWSHVGYHNGWIVFNFEFKEDLERVLCGGPYSACGTRLVLKPMPDDPFAWRERPKVSNEWLV